MERPDLGPGRHRRRRGRRRRAAPLVWTIAWPLYIRSPPATRGSRRRGRPGDQLDLVDEGRRLGERADARRRGCGTLPPGGVAARDGVDRPAGAVEGDAERRPDRAGPDDPDDRRLAGLASDVRVRVVVRRGPAVAVAVVARRRAGRGRCPPPRSPPRSCRRRASRGRVGAAARRGLVARAVPQAFTGSAGSRRRAKAARAVLFHATSVPTASDGGRVPNPDPFDARASLGSGLPDYYRLDRVGDRLDLDRAPVTLKILLENVLRHAGRGIVRRTDVEALARWRPGKRGRGRDPVHAGPRPAPGLHRRARGRRPGRDARRDGRPRRRPGEGQSAGAGRPRHRPLGPGRPVRDARRLRVQRRSRVRAQRRALPAAALGPDRVPGPAGRAAGNRHRPPGQPRVPRHGRRPTRRTAAAAGSPSRTRSSGPTRTRR